MKDMTKGSEAKLIFNFALPMFIGNIFQQLYNTVDSVIVGRALGKEALGAVGASNPIMFLLISLIIGVAMGSSILISQYFGARDMDKVKKTIDTAYIFLFIASIAVTIVGVIFSGPILRFMKTPDSIIHQAKSYLNVIFIGIIAMFGYNSISAILRGLGDSKTPLIFLIISTVINIVLDIVFVLVFNWGVAGAAWATVIAQTCSFIFGIHHLNKTHDVFKFNVRDMKFDNKIFKESIRIGLPSGVQQMLFSFGMIAMQTMVNKFGADTVAAFTAASRVDTFASMPIMNFGAAISTFVAQNIGAGKMERVKKGYGSTLVMSTVICLIITIAMQLWGTNLVRLFNKDPRVTVIGTEYLKIISIFYVVISAMFITNGVLRGAGDTIFPMINSILSLWLIRIPIAYTLSPRLGSKGIWWSMPIAWSFGLVLTYSYYRLGRWKKKIKYIQNKEDDNSSEIEFVSN
ncbi:MATE family efflux transporter [Clostridium sp. MSJ-4]|uniref:Probable multidrug resistance protein NorM n=1 Tax=Clostridium simiarum TaxID=2841506 RepID=A0ABS6F0X3_9CLOT|nr:MATE family efflux transporter [Clostridium simiarum]MBU5592139.1 MATE family efflux transporter [Clostridium simiarum]